MALEIVITEAQSTAVVADRSLSTMRALVTFAVNFCAYITLQTGFLQDAKAVQFEAIIEESLFTSRALNGLCVHPVLSWVVLLYTYASLSSNLSFLIFTPAFRPPGGEASYC